jgi:hypothetical protein
MPSLTNLLMDDLSCLQMEKGLVVIKARFDGKDCSRDDYGYRPFLHLPRSRAFFMFGPLPKNNEDDTQDRHDYQKLIYEHI